MTKKAAPIAFTQLEEVLEERQKPDRRNNKASIPEGLPEDRRKQDRRDRSSKNPTTTG